MTATQNVKRRFFRFSLRQLLLLMTCAAVGCIALRYASPGTARTLFYGAIVFLATSALLAIHHTDESRAFWVGISLFGWLSLGVLNAHLFLQQYQRSDRQLISEFHPLAYDNLITNKISRAVYRGVRSSLVLHPPSSPPPGWFTERGGRDTSFGSSALFQYPDGTWYGTGPGPFYVPEEDFLAVADSIWVLLFAFAGGMLSRWLFLRNRGSAAAARQPAPHSSG